jgi:NADH:ubiquinone reductase (non-electrogenic)
MSRKRLVILGTGWGSFSVLKHVNKANYDVTVVSPRPYFLFTPLLASTVSGTLDHRAIIDPIRKGSTFRHSSDYQCAEAVKLDPKAKTLTVKSTLTPDLVWDLKYDKLVIGIGAKTNTFNITGVEDHAFFLKDIPDSIAIQKRLAKNLELALAPKISPDEQRRLLHVVIVGGGPTGVEFGAEFYDFMQRDIQKDYKELLPYVRVTIIDAGEILNMFDQRMQRYAQKKIRSRPNFELIERCGVKSVEDTKVTLADGSVIPCGLVVWSTGLKPNKSLDLGDVKVSKRGYIQVNPYLECLGYEDSLFAVGDCAEIDGVNMTKTAQVAEQQGEYLSKVVLENIKSEPFKFQFRGMFAYIGGYKAVTTVEETKLSPRLEWKGTHSWFLWRSAYLTKLGRWYNRFQVPFCWLRTFIWGRDISLFPERKQEVEAPKKN